MFFSRRPEPESSATVETPPYTVVTLRGPKVWIRMRDVEIAMVARGRPMPRSERPRVSTLKDTYTMEWEGDERVTLIPICASLLREYTDLEAVVELAGTFETTDPEDIDS